MKHRTAGVLLLIPLAGVSALARRTPSPSLQAESNKAR